MIELKLKDFKNINPDSLYLEPLIKVANENYNSDNPDLWGSVFLSKEKDYSQFYDFNLVEYDVPKVKVISIYAIEDGLTLYDHYVSFYLFKTIDKKRKEKNRKYKKLNSSEYLELNNEFTDLQ